MARKASPASILKSIEQSQGKLDMSDLAEKLIEVFGGPGKLAKEYHDSFKDTAAGSTARQKMIEGVLRYARDASPKGVEDDVSLLTDEDLERTIHDTLMKAGLTGASDAEGPTTEKSSADGGAVPQPGGGTELHPAAGA